LIKLITYLSALYLSDISAVYQSFRFRDKNNLLISFLLAWTSIRFIADGLSYILKFQLNLNIFPVFHISVLIEGILIIFFYSRLNKKGKTLGWMFIFPMIFFFLDVSFWSSIFESNGISFMLYNLMSVILMLKLLINLNKIENTYRPIIKALFIFHSVSFIYSILEHVIRINDDMMQIAYPIFLLSIVSLNLYIFYYLWSVRKS
jgi:hypothetical protein